MHCVDRAHDLDGVSNYTLIELAVVVFRLRLAIAPTHPWHITTNDTKVIDRCKRHHQFLSTESRVVLSGRRQDRHVNIFLKVDDDFIKRITDADAPIEFTYSKTVMKEDDSLHFCGV